MDNRHSRERFRLRFQSGNRDRKRNSRLRSDTARDRFLNHRETLTAPLSYGENGRVHSNPMASVAMA